MKAKNKPFVLTLSVLAAAGGVAAVAAPIAVIMKDRGNGNTSDADRSAYVEQQLKAQLANQLSNSPETQAALRYFANDIPLSPTNEAAIKKAIQVATGNVINADQIQDLKKIKTSIDPTTKNFMISISFNCDGQNYQVLDINTGISSVQNQQSIQTNITNNLANLINAGNIKLIVKDTTPGAPVYDPAVLAQLISNASDGEILPTKILNASAEYVAYTDGETDVAEPKVRLNIVATLELNDGTQVQLTSTNLQMPFTKYEINVIDIHEIRSRFEFRTVNGVVDYTTITGITPKGLGLNTLYIPKETVSFNPAYNEANDGPVLPPATPSTTAAVTNTASKITILDFSNATNFENLFNYGVEESPVQPGINKFNYWFPNVTTFKFNNLTKVKRLPEFIGYKTTKLTTVEMKGLTGLNELPNYFLNGASALTTVDLTGTNITKIGKNSFSDLAALATLDLSSLTSLTVQSEVFYKLPALTTLNLSGLTSLQFEKLTQDPTEVPGYLSFCDTMAGAQIYVGSEEVKTTISTSGDRTQIQAVEKFTATVTVGKPAAPVPPTSPRFFKRFK